MKSKYIDWNEFHEDIEFMCPFCHGNEYKDYDDLNDEEKTEVERVKPHEDDVEDYYEDNKEDFDFCCGECENGYIEPIYNFAYPLEYTDFDDENRKIALSCNLFMFEDEIGDVWMSLTGCGMDLSPNIISAYRLLERVPLEWAMEWRQDYKAYLSEEDHRLNAEACLYTLKMWRDEINNKTKAVTLYLDDPEYVKQKLDEQTEQFNKCLLKASEIEEPMVRGIVGVMCLEKANKEVVD